MQVNKILQEEEFSPLRFASRRFYRKANGNYQLIGIGKCIEKYRSPYVVVLRPLIPLAIGSLDLKYPNYWLAIGIAERFCSNEKIKEHITAPDLPPLILKIQTTKTINSLFTKALQNESKEDLLLGRLYKTTIGLRLAVKVESLDETLHKRVNMRKVFKFLNEIREKSFELPESDGLVITPQELDNAYRQVFSEEIKRWQELRKEQTKQRAENTDAISKEKQEEKAVSFADIYKKYDELKQELQESQDVEISFSEYQSIFNDDEQDDISKHLEL